MRTPEPKPDIDPRDEITPEEQRIIEEMEGDPIEAVRDRVHRRQWLEAQ